MKPTFKLKTGKPDIPEKDRHVVCNRNYIPDEAEKFLNSRYFIREKLSNGRLFCDLCGNEFTSINPFFIKIDDANKELNCVPCQNKKNGIDPEERNTAQRAKLGLVPDIPRIKVKDKPKPETEKIKQPKKIDDNQVSLF